MNTHQETCDDCGEEMSTWWLDEDTGNQYCKECATSCDGCWTEAEDECHLCRKERKEQEADEWFDTKYPAASCHRCDKKVTSTTVVCCGGGGGACETWYCQECHERGTEDCPVCAEMNN